MSKIRVNEITDLNDNLLWNVSEGVGGAHVSTASGDQTLNEALQSRVIYVDTIADLQALPTSGLVDGQQVQVKEYHAGTGLGGGEFYWDAPSTETDDGGTIFKVSSVATGRWKRIYEGETYLVDFGAIDGGSDQAPIVDQLNTSGRRVNLSGKTFAYTGDFSPVANFYNGTISATNRDFSFVQKTEESPATILQGRARIDYGTPNSVRVWVPDSLIMAGFRFFGTYRKPQGRQVSTGVNGSLFVSNETALSILNTKKLSNWYAVFAGVNRGDTVCSFVNLPFFRAHSLAGNTITLSDGGEGVGETTTSTTYDMANDVMVGSEVLVIQEGGNWSGRTATVTANTNGTITLDNVTGITSGDFFLVAPPGFTDYVYLGSWYLDTAEPRNRADTGDVVGALHFQIPGLPEAGAVSNQKISVRAMISPLATAYLGKLSYNLSTASTGSIAHSFRHDANSHVIAVEGYYKASSTTETPVTGPIQIPFSKTQAFWLEAAGSLVGSVTGRQFQCYGWIEP